MELTHHGLILGSTQTGKTTTAIRLLQQQQGLLIFVNSKLDRNFDSNFYAFATHENIDDILFDYRSGQAKDGFIYCFDVDPDQKRFADVVLLADKILKWHQQGLIPRTVIMIDEMHLYKKKIEPIEKLFTMGLGLGIIAVGISQRIHGVNNTIRENHDMLVLHSVKDAQLEFLETGGYVEIPQEYKVDDYMYKYKLWQHSMGRIDHTCYVQTDPRGLRKWF